MLETILIILHVVVSLFLIFVVLLQSGQAADLAGAFGGGGSQTALGMRSAATLLQKLTTASAIVFMLTSLSLGIVHRTETSVLDDLEVPGATQQAPASTTPTTVPVDVEPTTPTTVPDSGGGGSGGQGQGGSGQGSGQ